MITKLDPVPVADNLTNQLPSRDIVWAALEKVASKQKNPDGVQDGCRHIVNFDIQGLIDGQVFRQSVDSIVTVGHSQTRCSSVTPAVPELIAVILGKLNRKTQQRILADIPTEFIENDGSLPEADQSLVSQATEMLKRLRRSKVVVSRGPIRCQFMMTS